ncbi:MAG: hypothetical protein AAE985_06850 [Thermoplasmataceae archaeon]
MIRGARIRSAYTYYSSDEKRVPIGDLKQGRFSSKSLWTVSHDSPSLCPDSGNTESLSDIG